MTARFMEAFPCIGFDDEERSAPGLIVPLGGTNIFAVTGGKAVRVSTKAPNIALKPIDSGERDLFPSVARQIKLLDGAKNGGAPLPADVRFWSVKGNDLKGGADGVVVTATLDGKDAVLRVFVLDKRTVKIAVREIVSVTGKATPVRHSQKNHDIPKLVDAMNAIWQPQANVVFEVGETKPFELPGPLPDDFNIDEHKKALGAGLAGAEYGMFFVRRAISQPKATTASSFANAWTDHEYKVTIVGDSSNTSTMAHEAGHLMGQVGHWKPNVRHLLQDGGPGVGVGKIPIGKLLNLFNNKYVHDKKR